MSEKIKIKLSDWQFNAGIVGLCNILEHAKDEVKKENQHIEVKLESLENFAEKYFNYFIEKYHKYTPWYRIVSYKSIMESHKYNNFKNFDEKSLNALNDYIRKMKGNNGYLKRNNHKKSISFYKTRCGCIGARKKVKAC